MYPTQVVHTLSRGERSAQVVSSPLFAILTCNQTTPHDTHLARLMFYLHVGEAYFHSRCMKMCFGSPISGWNRAFIQSFSKWFNFTRVSFTRLDSERSQWDRNKSPISLFYIYILLSLQFYCILVCTPHRTVLMPPLPGGCVPSFFYSEVVKRIYMRTV